MNATLKGFGFSLWTKNNMTRIYVNGIMGFDKYWLESSSDGSFVVRSRSQHGIEVNPMFGAQNDIYAEVEALFGRSPSFAELVEACK